VPPPPTKLIIRVDQIQTDGGDPPIPGGAALYRLVDNRMSVCAKHLAELSAYLPRREARPVLTLDQIDSLVSEFGLRRGDLMALHGPWDPIFGAEKCQMCETVPAEGNVCHDDGCKTPLHPQWSAVYCSDACAVHDG